MCYFLTDFLIYFSIKELYRLKLTCKQYNESINKDVINKFISNKINERLRDHVSNFDEFQRFFCSSKAFISGSFIIQSILDEYYYHSDLDIYIPVSSKTESYNFKDFKVTNDTNVYDNAEQFGALEICRVVDYKRTKPLFTNEDDSNDDDIPDLVRFGEINRLQLIYVKINDDKQSIINYITTNFDFDICKNFYRFNEIYIKNFSQIINKQLHFKLKQNNWSIDKTMNRGKKYRERGFNLINNYSLQELSGEKIDIYHIKMIENHLDQIIEGDVNKLTDISQFVYPGKSKIYGTDARAIDNNTTHYCECCDNYSLFIYDETLKFHLCKYCIEIKATIEKRSLMNDPNIIYLSNIRRNTQIDHYVDFYYPNKNTRILWYGIRQEHHYLFVIV